MVAETPEGVCVVDTDATVEQFLRVATISADAILVVVEPYFTSLETGRRMTRLGKLQGYERIALIVNKVRNEGERAVAQAFAEEHGLEVAGFVPHDLRLPDAEWAESAPLDFDPGAEAVAAIDELAGWLIEMAGQGSSGNGKEASAEA